MLTALSAAAAVVERRLKQSFASLSFQGKLIVKLSI